MANNLFVSYDLNSPGQNYETVIDEIKNLGNWANLQKSHWYVNSTLSASEAAQRVWNKMDKNDSLIVVDATNNVAAWHGLSSVVSEFIRNEWNK